MPATNLIGGGKGATFDITLANGVPTVVLRQPGNGYHINDTMLIKGSDLGGVDGVNDLTITVGTIASEKFVAMGSGVGAARIGNARFSGQLIFSASESFSLTSPLETKLLLVIQTLEVL